MNDAPQVPEMFDGNKAADAFRAADSGVRANEALQGKSILTTEVDPDKPRTFIAPQHPGGRFLIQVGVVEQAPYQQQVLGLKPDIRRNGDIWLKFNSGIASVRPSEDFAEEKVAWLVAHQGVVEDHVAYHKNKNEDPRACQAPIGLCRENGPGVDVWAQLKSGQVATAHSNATIDPGIDIDAAMRGELTGSRNLKTGVGADAAAAAEAAENAARERAGGQHS